MSSGAPGGALLLAAPRSGAGKTMVALALLRAFAQSGARVAGAKSGPDYIDPTFHHAASGRPSVNLDAWAMGPAALRARAAAHLAETGAELLLIEGAMGLLDGAPDPERPLGRGSAADLAAALGAPVVLVLDVAAQSASAVAAPLGFRAARPDLHIAGAILNRVGSARHRAMAERALEAMGIPVFGALPRLADLETPSRHLGLAPAGERADLEAFLDRAGGLARESLDLARLRAAAAPVAPEIAAPPRLPPLGARIAVARDAAFVFAYPHLLADWRAQGAEIAFFSPLENEAPDPSAEAVFLPGGYPELHAGRLAAAERFRGGLAAAAARGAWVYGECGGYMVLGETLTDAGGLRHPMTGLLPVETSFLDRRLHLGYRRLTAPPGGPFAGALAAHEHHYATIIAEGAAERLFTAEDAMGEDLGPMGLRRGRVCGSFAHLIGPAEA